MIKLFLGDCLVESKKIKEGSIDLILMDPPYGNMNTDGGRKIGIHNWDFQINTKDLFNIANRILRKNGKLILFSQEPYSSMLVSTVIPNLPFSYRAIWEKDNFANALGVNKAMVGFTEDILIFSKMNPVHDSEFIHPLRPYFKSVFEFIGTTKKNIIDKVGQKADHVFRFNSSQFSLCTRETYDLLIDNFRIDLFAEFINFEELSKIDLPFKAGLNSAANTVNPSIFNLWEGKKFKSNILKYKKDYDGFHPTQKPVLLLEDLIKTFSNEGNLVVDLTMGSGSTGVACKNTNRNFIGIEMDEKFFDIAKNRIGL